MAHLHRLFGLSAVMHLLQVKNCVKLVAQETKTLFNRQGTGMKHVETFVLEQRYKQLYQRIQSKQQTRNPEYSEDIFNCGQLCIGQGEHMQGNLLYSF